MRGIPEGRNPLVVPSSLFYRKLYLEFKKLSRDRSKKGRIKKKMEVIMKLLKIKLWKKALCFHKKAKPIALFTSNHPDAHAMGLTCLGILYPIFLICQEMEERNGKV